MERRAFVVTELRAKGGSTPRITGHAAVFNQLSEDLGGFREKIAPGAFTDTIQDGDIRALWNHDPNFPLARTKSKTLRLKEDDEGLAIDADLPDTSYARDLIISIERRDVDQMSFGFMVLPDGQKWRLEDGGIVRILTKVELFDVSPVTFPAYPQTDVSARAELRSMAEAALKELTANDPQAKEAFLKRMAERRAAIASRTLPPDPFSYKEILKRAAIRD